MVEKDLMSLIGICATIATSIYIWRMPKNIQKYNNADIEKYKNNDIQVKCTNCNKMTVGSHPFCMNCGILRCKCSQCNTRNDCSDKFCMKCAAPINQNHISLSKNENLKKIAEAPKDIRDIVSNDKELSSLKLELKSLEGILQNLIEQKTGYLNDIEEFNKEYNIHLGENIRTILSLKKEILYKKTIKWQKLKTKYQEDLQTCKETKETIDELTNNIEELKVALESIDDKHESYDDIVSAYTGLQEELEKLQEELSVQEEELEKTKETLEEDVAQEKFEEAKMHYEEFSGAYEHIKKTKKEIIKLNDEEKAELKKLYRKAARLSHPDITPDELKEKAHELMQQLNAAYSKQDLKAVQKILNSLENGDGFELSSQNINDKELIKEKIKEFKENIANLEKEIEEIKLDEIFETISELEDWDEYFEELKSELVVEKERFEEEVSEILEEKEEETSQISQTVEEEIAEWMQKIWDWADENNIPDFDCESFHIDDFENPFYGEEHRCIGFPRNIHRLLNFETLELGYENIMKLPNELSRLRSLEYLILTNNPITHLPIDIGKLKALIVLNLSECQLEQLPESITKLVNLEFLDLRNNDKLQITDKQKTWLEKLKNNGCRVEIDGIHCINLKKQSIEKESSPYAKYLLNIQNPNFEKIRRYCNNLVDENQADEMQEYLAENGKMHKALMYDALEQFLERLDGETITLIDWGCEQGIVSMLVLDYIREKQLATEVAVVLLIDDDTKALSRAMVQVEALAGNTVKTVTIKSDDENVFDVIKTHQTTITLNLFANDAMPIDFLEIDYDIFEEAYFMCVSSSKRELVDEIYEDINEFIDTQKLSSRDGQIGRFQRFERIFKGLN